MTQFAYRKLEDILQLSRGFDITKAQQTEGEYPVISSSGPSSYNGQYKCKGPGVITGRKGTLGKVFFTAGNYWPHDTTLWVKNFKGNDPRYIYYLLTILHFESFDVGASNPTLNRNHIHKIAVQFPDDLITQQRIAGILSSYDELIEVNNQRIRLLEETARQLYKEWFVRLRFPGHEQTHFVKGLPEGWDIVSIGKVIDFNIGGGWGADKADNECTIPGYVIRGTDIPGVRIGSPNTTVYRFHKKSNMKSRQLIEGDIVFETAGGSEGQPLGRTAFITQEILDAYGDKVMCASFCKLLRPSVTKSLYVYYFINALYESGQIETYQTQSTGISNYQFEPFLRFQQIIVPPDELLKSFHDKVTLMQKQIANLGSQNTHLRQIRDRLLPRLISGKLSVGAVEREVASEPNLA